jgi:hypothetical protein
LNSLSSCFVWHFADYVDGGMAWHQKKSHRTNVKKLFDASEKLFCLMASTQH